MATADQYREIAQRYLQAAHHSLTLVHEAAGFAAYHSFESIAAAWILRSSQAVPRSHSKKLTTFIRFYQSESDCRAVATVAIAVSSVRNRMLYPSPDAQNMDQTPQNLFTHAEVSKLLSRVNGLVIQIANKV